MKRLLPSLREKKRYLIFKIIGGEFSFRDAKKSIIDSCLRFMGENGLSKAKIKLIKNLFDGDKGVIRVDKDMVGELKTGLALIRRINKRKVILKTIKLCGTLDNCEKVLKKVS